MSGEMVVTRDQTLADGNSIHTQNQTTIYRDSEGRMRREIQFELDHSVHRRCEANHDRDHGSGVGKSLYAQSGKQDGAPDAASSWQARPGCHARKMGVGPDREAMHDMPGKIWIGSNAANLKTEQLGTKTINGLQAVGTRMTRTIPAGEIGNQNPIEVVTERWYSSDLQLPLLETHNDPMMGTMTIKLVNINRGEPDASLFQVPSDYKLISGKPGEPLYMPMHPASTFHSAEVRNGPPPFSLPG